jgi:hypothetical protein
MSVKKDLIASAFGADEVDAAFDAAQKKALEAAGGHVSTQNRAQARERKRIKTPWTKKEDDIIIHMVTAHGAKRWSRIADELPGRIGKQCRERWHNQLNPEIRWDPFDADEDRIIITNHEALGSRWTKYAKILPGRTDNSIKNRWNRTMKWRIENYLRKTSTRVNSDGEVVTKRPDGRFYIGDDIEGCLQAIWGPFMSY